MPIDAAPLIAFAFATSITPGPNNLMLMASGARFGLRRTTPHLLGVTLGFGVLALALGFGLGQALQTLPTLRAVMTVAALSFMLYLAWKVATAGDAAEPAADARPLSFFGAVLFQWINPKTWAMALSVVTLYAADVAPIYLIAAVALFCAVNLPCCGAWAVAGRHIARLLRRPYQRRAFNISMAVLMIASMAPVLF